MSTQLRMILATERTATTFGGGCHWGTTGFQGTDLQTTEAYCNGSSCQNKDVLPPIVPAAEVTVVAFDDDSCPVNLDRLVKAL
jgi:peptide methionine sulfoxide reductase MsrA